MGHLIAKEQMSPGTRAPQTISVNHDLGYGLCVAI